MRTAYLLDALESAVLALRLENVTRENIARPNAPFDFGAYPLYCEVFASDFSTRPETEESLVTNCSGAIVVSGGLGVGIEEVDAIAQALFDLFSPYNELGARKWTRREKIGRGPEYKESRVYVVGVERSNGTVVDGRYKVKVTVKLEIYEEKKL